MTVFRSTQWHWAMRATLFLGTANATRLAVYENFTFVLGHQMTLIIILLMSLFATFIGPLFRLSWPASVVHMYWASSLTGVISTMACLSVLSPFQMDGDIGVLDVLMSMISGAMSGAVIMVIALMTKPLSLLSWAIGTLVIGYCARREVYWLEEENGDMHTRQHANDEYSVFAHFRWR